MNISVVGCGYVGLVTGACLASLGHHVIGVDTDKKKIDCLRKSKAPFYEPGLEKLLKEGIKKKTLSFTSDLRKAVKKSEIIFIAVGTPPKPSGEAELCFVENVARMIAKEMTSYKLVVEKSTVPVHTGERIYQTITHHVKKGIPFDVASNPEFLREGTAIHDFMKPDRIVLGVETKTAKDILLQLYKPLKRPILVTDIKSAEIIKHASNSFLAMKISFINAISVICEKTKANVEQVALGIGLDHRIGRDFLNPGIGFGGFCFPKDLAAFIRISEKLGYDFELLKAVEKINLEQRKLYVKRVEEVVWNLKGKTVGILGLSFKPNTDDMRFAPSIDIIADLQALGARIKAYDPHAMPKARETLKKVTLCKDSYAVCKESDCLLILTEWQEFKALNLGTVKRLLNQPVIVDGRNIFDPIKMKELGFRYFSIGRP